MQDFNSVNEQLKRVDLSLSEHYSGDRSGNKYLGIFNGEQKPIGRLYQEGNGQTYIFTDRDSRDKLIKTGITIPAFLCNSEQLAAFEEKTKFLRESKEQLG